MQLENNISLTQNLQQTTKLSPQQIQGMKMLELPTLELEERIEQELTNNPALEIDDEPLTNRDEDNENADNENDDNYDEDNRDFEERNDADKFNELDNEDISGYYSDDDTYDSGFDTTQPTSYDSDFTSYYRTAANGDDFDNREIPFSAGTTFQEYLHDQVGMLQITPQQREIVEYVLGNLDDDGLLKRDAHRLVNDLLFAGHEIDEQQINDAIQIVQSLDPAGVGATSLEECILLQLRRKTQTPVTGLAIKIIENHFNELKQKHYNRIASRLNITEDQLSDAIELISHLNPKPGQQWNGDVYERNSNILVPDFFVTHRNGYWEITLNNDNIPRLRINADYNKWATNYRDNRSTISQSEKEQGKFAQKYVTDAMGFIKNLNDRNTNLRHVMEAIVKAQEQFFLIGDDQLLKPLVLQDIATKVDLDVSTVSRITKTKYVSCDVGTFLLRHFFSESITNNEGEDIATTAVKSVLREIIDKEDKTNPLKDEELVEIITKRGYPIARRTVAKYRHLLNIPTARLRQKI